MKLAEPQATLVRSMGELERKTRANCDEWGMDAAARWDADLETGEIAFTFSNGVVVTAPVQVIGTYSLDEGTWLWAWANPSINVELAEHARLARSFGERHNLPEFTASKITCSEDDAARFTAVACHLGKAAGAYRGPSGSTYAYFAFGATTLHRSN